MLLYIDRALTGAGIGGMVYIVARVLEAFGSQPLMPGDPLRWVLWCVGLGAGGMLVMQVWRRW